MGKRLHLCVNEEKQININSYDSLSLTSDVIIADNFSLDKVHVLFNVKPDYFSVDSVAIYNTWPEVHKRT